MTFQEKLFGGTAASHGLFPDKLLNAALARFIFPEDLDQRRAKLEPWVHALHAGKLAKETAVHGEFLQSIFVDLLGYKGVAASGAGPYTLAAEKSVASGGGQADGAIGFFGRVNAPPRTVAPIELKGSETDLDRPMARGYTPVQQGWWYANETPDCPWVIVSNYREIRLYSTSKTPQRFQRFTLETLPDPATFRAFYFCLCAQNILSQAGPSLLESLVRDAGEEQENITNHFYKIYQRYRLSLIESLILANPAAQRRVLIEKAQKLMDRALFIAFCEDRGLLRPDTIKNAYQASQPGMSRWAPFDGLFKALRDGDRAHDIPAYNGGLFAPDPDLDILCMPDNVADIFHGLSRFDFTSELDVDILGHVFEQSVTDLEQIRKKHLFGEMKVREGRRKKQGIVYTPAYITNFIYERSVGRLLREKRAVLEERHKLGDAYEESTRKASTEAFWREYGAFLESLRILDIGCGSGAFLIATFDALALEYQAVNKAMEELTGAPLWANPAEVILTKNLFGVDLAQESVEITRLSLWLKTARRDQKLASLDRTIVCANSLVEDKAVDGAALVWRKAFPEVMKSGGFDVVLGNPPYVCIQNFAREHEAQAAHFASTYRSAFQNYDLYVLFVERGLGLLKPDGILGYILPRDFFIADYGQGLRGLIAEEKALAEVVDLDRNQIFAGVTTYPALLFLRRGTEEGAWHHLPDGTDVSEALRVLQTGKGRTPATVPASTLTSAPWSFRSGESGTLLDRLKGLRPILEEVAQNIFQGLVTSADPVYILEDRGPAGEGYRRLFRPVSKHKGTGMELKEREVILEETFLKALFKDGHLEPFFLGPPDHRIIFPYDLSGDRPMLVTEERLRMEAPKTWAWIEEHEGLLRMREKGKMNREGWWGYVYPKNLDAFEGPKLLIPGFGLEQRFVYDAEDVYFTGRGDSGYGIRLKKGGEQESLYTLALLNSRLAGFFQASIAKHFQGGYYSSGKRFLAQIPVLEAKDALKKTFAATVKEIMGLKRQRFELLKAGRHRLLSEVAGKPFASFSKKLDQWPNLEFNALQDELQRLFKKTIPFQDRPDWEALLLDTRNRLATQSRQIAQLENDLNRRVYKLYGLNDQEIAVVEGA